MDFELHYFKKNYEAFINKLITQKIMRLFHYGYSLSLKKKAKFYLNKISLSVFNNKNKKL